MNVFIYFEISIAIILIIIIKYYNILLYYRIGVYLSFQIDMVGAPNVAFHVEYNLFSPTFPWI